ncbi:hypothetical protein CH379_017655 [Leptospira ellisii]|uniref:Uncharacterized protein n=1 Tax=Leptospira ellisii TaxID=2023197 RepID=A0AAE4QQX9_9LEPT|nr:hypothetical protein [Leptospira ellisii]MDV6237463.1 hypothetical protein [Leptospira ellisii]
MKFHDLVDEKSADLLEDGENGEALLEEILKSFERFDRELGNSISEFLSSDQK